MLPLPENKGNMRGSSRVQNHRKLKYWARLDSMWRTGRLKLLPGADRVIFPIKPDGTFGYPGWQVDRDGEIVPPLDHVIGRATYYLPNEMDDTNSATRLKWPEDFLVSRGYLASDRRSNLRWAHYPDQYIDRKGEPRIVILFSEREWTNDSDLERKGAA